MSSTIEKTTEPIQNTAAYKTLAETIVDALDDSGTAKHAVLRIRSSEDVGDSFGWPRPDRKGELGKLVE